MRVLDYLNDGARPHFYCVVVLFCLFEYQNMKGHAENILRVNRNINCALLVYRRKHEPGSSKQLTFLNLNTEKLFFVGSEDGTTCTNRYRASANVMPS